MGAGRSCGFDSILYSKRRKLTAACRPACSGEIVTHLLLRNLGRLTATKSTRSKEQRLSSNPPCAKVNRSELPLLKGLEGRSGGCSLSLCRQNLVRDAVRENLSKSQLVESTTNAGVTVR